MARPPAARDRRQGAGYPSADAVDRAAGSRCVQPRSSSGLDGRSDGEGWYGFPLLRKATSRSPKDRLGGVVDADIDRAGTAEFAAEALAFVRARLPDLAAGTVFEGRSCLYTATPDDHFLVDRVPGTEGIYVAGGGSGHGFKFGGSLGPLIVDAVENRPNPLGDRFRIGSRLDADLTSPSATARGFGAPQPA